MKYEVPQAGIESIRSKLASKIFDEYSNILKGMYSTRINGRSADSDVSAEDNSAPRGPMPPLIASLQPWQPNNIRRPKVKKERDRE